ncbi:MAG: cytochrome c oxidase subunit 3 [Acidobacteria bacterium]|nr:cytochrome c oxidase subunit 3 [Acidobacteriota bacterium]MDA1234969.1 cytochrome c oxidase subunit 3 [Acidobacteriota bacterium]
MAVTLQPPADAKRPTRVDVRSAGSGGFGSPPPDTRGWGGGDSGGDGFHSEQRYKLAVWVGIAGIVMFFAAISSAMVVSSVREDWRHITLPPVLWLSSGALLLSSLTFEAAKRAVRRRGAKDVRKWMLFTALLGVGFLIGQFSGWSQMLSQGVVLRGQPSGAFFYLLTAAHGLHVLGGLGVLGYVVMRVSIRRPWPRPKAVVEAAALYWHFIGVLWLYIVVLLLYLG